MPYTGISDVNLPNSVKKLPKGLRKLWVKVFNESYDPDDEGKAFRAAWAAVRKAGSNEEANKMATMKTDGGQKFGAGAYLIVPDPEKPSTWKLRVEETPGKITVAQLGRAAAAIGPKGYRGNKASISADDRKAAARKLISLYREQKVDAADIPDYLWGIAGMKKPAEKSINLNDIQESIRNTFADLYRDQFWVQEIFDDYVIVRRELTTTPEPASGVPGRRYPMYKVPYTFERATVPGTETEMVTAVTFADRAEWTEVVPVFAGLKTFEQPDGRTRWLTISSGGFEDRDHEVVSTAFLKDATQRAKETGHGPLLMWHIPTAKIGECDTSVVVGEPGFLLESGLFDDTPDGRNAAAYYREHAGETGCSIKFLWAQKTAENVYLPPGMIVERSLLPRKWAAFPWSAITMKGLADMPENINPEALAELKKVLGDERAEKIIENLQLGAEELKEMGVRFKEVAEASEAEAEASTETTGDPETAAKTATETEAEPAAGIPGGDEFSLLLEPETLQAIAKEVATPLEADMTRLGEVMSAAIKEVKTALEALNAQVAELSRAESERIADQVAHLPRATLKRKVQRPSQREPEPEAEPAVDMLQTALATLYGEDKQSSR